MNNSDTGRDQPAGRTQTDGDTTDLDRQESDDDAGRYARGEGDHICLGHVPFHVAEGMAEPIDARRGTRDRQNITLV